MTTPSGRLRLGPEEPVVVIGAGIIGCCAAYHLLKSGARNVTVIDTSEPGSGTTSAGAGFVALWAAGTMPLGETGLGMERYSLQFYGDLAAAGYDIAYRNNGNLILALTDRSWQDVGIQVARHPAASPGTRTLTPAEISAETGVIDAAAVYSATLMPTAVQVETGLAVSALAGLIRQLGGTIRTGLQVGGFRTGTDQVQAVTTPDGDITAAAVIVAAGAWTNTVLQHLGTRLPLLRIIATRIVTQPLGVPATMPTVQCDDFGLWIRESGGAFTWGSASAYRPAYWLERTAGPIAAGRPRSRELLDLQLAEQARVARIFPGMAGARVASWMQGMPVYTPDSQLFAGPLPAYGNVIVLAGDNESGVAHGPGMGRVAAEIVRGEQPFVDIRPCRLDRFGPAQFPDEESVREHLRTQDWAGPDSGG